MDISSLGSRALLDTSLPIVSECPQSQAIESNNSKGSSAGLSLAKGLSQLDLLTVNILSWMGSKGLKPPHLSVLSFPITLYMELCLNVHGLERG